MSYVQNELSPEWKAQPQEIQDAYMKMMKSRLGALQSVDQFSAIQTSYRTENGNGITYVTVRAGARFEKAPGTVRMVVEKKDDKWLIFSMKIDSDVFDNTSPSTPKGTKV